MTKQTKWALAVVAFVVTATVARRVGQYEMLDQVEKRVDRAEPTRDTGNFISDALYHPLHDCILDGDRSSCREIAEKLKAKP